MLLLARRFVQLVPINPGGRGKRFQLLELTDEGRALLKTFEIPLPNGHGRGGLAHQWWCRTIAEWLTDCGFAVFIEDETRGARIDLVATSTAGGTLAIEVETSSGHEIENIRKDIAAGFRTVVSLVNDQAAMRRVQCSLDAHSDPSSDADTLLGLLADYPTVLGALITPSS